MSRLPVFVAAAGLLAASSAQASTVPLNAGLRPAAMRAQQSWAASDIRYVVAHGLMSKTVAAFRPSDPLTQGELGALVAGLTKQTVPPSTTPSVHVTVTQLDARLVRALDLSDAATLFSDEVRAAGLAPPARFGTETVARLLGLRTDHPAAHDDLELLPSDEATRAEAAFSAAQILRFSGSEQQGVDDAAAAFTLPALTTWQTRILTTAVHFVGYPYVWGGTSELPEAPFKVHAHGGFDCSGFVWRVYKLQAYPGGTALSGVLKGRTTYAMSAEVPKAKRIPFARLAPADVIFFGDKGPASTPAQVGHVGIYMGNGWFIHSSGQGVALVSLSGWYKKRFAWARRPLAEARLTP
jgi:cell wall-associated NlpC family hydrolase